MSIINNKQTQTDYGLLARLRNELTGIHTPVKISNRVDEQHVVQRYNAIQGVTMTTGTIVVLPLGEPVPLKRFSLIGYNRINGVEYGAWRGYGDAGSALTVTLEQLWDGVIELLNETIPVEDVVIVPTVVEASEQVVSTQVESPSIETIANDLSERVYYSLIDAGVTTIAEMLDVAHGIIAGTHTVKYVGESTANKLIVDYGA
jgi:hypothetical protein